MYLSTERSSAKTVTPSLYPITRDGSLARWQSRAPDLVSSLKLETAIPFTYSLATKGTL